MEKKIKAIIFDADSTLYHVPTKIAYRKEFEFLSHATGIPKDKIETKWKELIEKISKSKNPEKRRREYSTEKLLMFLGVDKRKVKPLVKRALEIFWKELIKNIKVEKNTKRVLANLSKKYYLAVASEEFRKNLEMKLKAAGLKKYFKVIVTPEDVGRMKPDKRYYTIALKKLGIDLDEAIALGDSMEKDGKPAQDLGIRFILTNSENLTKDLKKINDN